MEIKIKSCRPAINVLIICSFLVSGFFSFAQSKKNYYDGPYINIVGDSIKIKWIDMGTPHDSVILKSAAGIFNKPNLPVVDLTKLDIVDEEIWEFDNIKKFVVISDLHGQYDTLISLLKIHEVIDKDGNWNFADNHLIVAGDHFSRGDKVLDILWFMFKLEKQAQTAGGKVHILLGNHEVMTMNNDLRYLNVKYAYTAGALQTQYYEFFSTSSVLGNWLRKKNIIVTINDNLIVHGGISQKIVDAKISAQEINHLFKNTILVSKGKELVENDKVALLTGDDGPLWYRGYSDTLSFHEDSLNTILSFYNVSSIIVGHTIMPEITPRFKGKLFFIDCGLISGNKGELLIWKEDRFYKGKANGKKSELNKVPKKEKRSLFETIYNMNDDNKNPKLNINTNFKNLIKNKLKEVEQPSEFELLTSRDSSIISMKPTVRARGNMRKQVCYFPPIKFNFLKKDLSDHGLKSADKLKLVFPCREGDTHQEKLYQEYFLYTLYQIIDSNSVRAKLIDIKITNEKQVVTNNFIGIIVEDEDSYALRTDARIVESKAVLNSTVLDRKPFLIMYFFQYMIANTDWSVGNRHNVLIAKLPNNPKIVAQPYDYDYSGFVDQGYAVPAESLPIKSVNQRYFMPYVISDEEFDFAVKYYQDIKQNILDKCNTATYLKPETIESNKKFLLEFFKELEKPEKLRKYIKTKE